MMSQAPLAPARELHNSTAVRRLGSGDQVACPIEGHKRAPRLGWDPFRRGKVVVALPGRVLVSIAGAFEWFRRLELVPLHD